MKLSEMCLMLLLFVLMGNILINEYKEQNILDNYVNRRLDYKIAAYDTQ